MLAAQVRVRCACVCVGRGRGGFFAADTYGFWGTGKPSHLQAAPPWPNPHQTTRMSFTVGVDAPPDLLSTAYRLGGGGSRVWVGAFRSGSPPFAGWMWLDGTSATNMKATAAGDGIWASSEPNNGGYVVCMHAYTIGYSAVSKSALCSAPLSPLHRSSFPILLCFLVPETRGRERT